MRLCALGHGRGDKPLKYPALFKSPMCVINKVDIAETGPSITPGHAKPGGWHRSADLQVSAPQCALGLDARNATGSATSGNDPPARRRPALRSKAGAGGFLPFLHRLAKLPGLGGWWTNTPSVSSWSWRGRKRHSILSGRLDWSASPQPPRSPGAAVVPALALGHISWCFQSGRPPASGQIPPLCRARSGPLRHLL